MLRYRIYIAIVIGAGFATLVFLVLTSLGSNLAVSLIAIAMLMPGISLLQSFLHNCCESPLPMLAINIMFYSGAAFLTVWQVTRNRRVESIRRAARYVTFLTLGVVALGWGTARILESAWSAPSDEAMIKTFNQHRGELESLVSIAHEAKWAEYRGLCHRIGVTAGPVSDNQGNIYFIFHTEGSVVSGGSKGFVYCERTGVPGSGFLPCVEQRDAGKSEDGKGNGSEYRRLAEHWYLYSDWN